MSASRAPLRGNKIFLPKLKFQKVKKKPLSDILQLDENNSESDHFSDEGENWSESHAQIIPLWQSELQTSTFTRFTVLPPILGKRFSPKDFEYNRLSSGLNAIEDTQSLPGEYNKGKFVRRASYLKRQKTTVDHELELNGNEIERPSSEGEVVLPKARKQSLNKQFQKSYSETNADVRLGSRMTPKVSVSDSSLEKESLTLKKCKICSILGPELINGSCSHQQRFFEESLAVGTSQPRTLVADRLSVNSINEHASRLQRSNSEEIIETTLKGNTLFLPKREENSDLTIFERRPLSRCQIDLDLTQMEYSDTEKNQQANAEQLDEQANIFPTTIVSNEENELFSATNSENKLSFETPQIQILIESIDDAKDDLPKQTLGVPFTSTREKRRRSALCRNNTKQVDDFLLVHNLKDLGLL